MSFSIMMELLQRKNKGNIILVNLGAFYIARGRDAILLNNLLNLKVNCLETEVCKVGFPLNALEKYTNLIEQKGYSYIVYNFDSKNAKLNIDKKYAGSKLNEIKQEKLNCYICSNTMEQIYEIGKILGGLLKYYVKNN